MLENIMSEAQAALFEKIVAETNKAVITAHSAVTDNGNSDLLFHNFLPKRFSKAFLAFPF